MEPDVKLGFVSFPAFVHFSGASMTSRFIAALLVISLALPFPAQAAMLSIDSGQRDQINRLLERADLQSRLQANGVSAQDVKARVAAMTDDEVAQLAARIDQLPAGGEGIIGALLVIFIVLLITDILGFTKVFPFTKPVK
jgi:hypothetical protein